ncbi:PREDICTED: uncharacterized protein LOC109589158 isoform X3 [Amphimedon queenslandica]|uniref:Death domain-containing protein n=1 Tax=Amphimedon queenslandica TaxID=400682 RepID=A0AAN0JVB8_AMPQE|nr:PREDICTED: uncharacterized protein LOC109589158 isoform X3 [Amphimedon queenslandica]|eukprot:XP_019860834.1 PREDICTED: uncharacterized protein LOC109589158 isoform X3 [Amphimedon queenslandica]
MASFSTPPSPLDSSPREDLWAEWLEPLTKWQTFGLYLPGIKQKDIDKIEEDKTGVESRKMGLWTKWTGVYPPGTWTDVISALKRLKENALAADIEERLRKGKVFEIKKTNNTKMKHKSSHTSTWRGNGSGCYFREARGIRVT